MNKKVHVRDLGKIAYKAAWDEQTRLFQQTITRKLENRKRPENERLETENHFLLCEHNPVFTLGKTGNPEHLKLSDEQLKWQGIAFYPINRGGDITYHGPGQITGYPIFDLDNFFSDIGKYMRLLEEAIIQVIALYGLKGERIEGLTGVWLDVDNPEKVRKICAIGVHSSRWVTMHGFGFNVTTDLSYFDMIVPCGITDKGVTSLAKEVGPVNFEQVKAEVVQAVLRIFEAEKAPEVSTFPCL